MSGEHLSQTEGLRVERVNRRELLAGMGLILLSFILPDIIHVGNFRVFYFLERALYYQEKTELLLSALQLVMLNTVRSIPHYLGSYLVGESITFRLRKKETILPNAALIVGLLWLTYKGIWHVHDIHYDFGMPAVVVTVLMLFFRKMDYQYLSLNKKMLQIVPFLAAVQFLDIIPFLRKLPVGRGETSWDIKQAAELLQGEMFLNGFGMIGFLLFGLFGVLISAQLREENRLRELNTLKEQNEKFRIQAQVNEMKNRTHQEMQYLVHDLKSPLTAMQTLVGMLKMEGEQDNRPQDVECLTSIETSIQRMSQMISELLYENQRSLVRADALVRGALAQISVMEFARRVQVDNRAARAQVLVNRVLFVRALVNLIQNSADAAVPGRPLSILLRVEEREIGGRSWVCFSVQDNGRGIRSEDREKIWEHGVSGSESSGFGLAFVRRVMDGVEGRIALTSQPGEGTTFELFVPEEGEHNDEERSYNLSY